MTGILDLAAVVAEEAPTLLAQLQRGPGNYINWFKFVPVILVYLIWIYTTNWVERDMRELRGANEIWKPIVFLVGILGVFIAFAVPWYLVQLPVQILCWFLPLLFYINYRNTRVKEHQAVTFGSIVRDALSKVGIDPKDDDGEDDLEGPPVKLVARQIGETNQNMALVEQVEQSEGLVPTKELLFDAIGRRATDVLLEPKKEKFAVRYRIDGVPMAAEPFDKPTGKLVFEVIKTVAHMDPAERRKPQKGSFAAETLGRKIELRVASQGTTSGERLSLRFYDEEQRLTKVDQIGMREKTIETIRGLLAEPQGLFMVTGAAGSGTTTTLYSLMRDIDRFTRNVVCFEDQTEYQVDNVLHIEYSKNPDVPVHQQLVSVIRQVPDVIGLGDLRNKEVADLACDNAQDDRMVIGIFPAKDSISGMLKFLDLGIDRKTAVKGLLGVLNQRLVRRLCDHCKEPYKPKAEFLKKANLQSAKIEFFYRPPRDPEEPCPECAGNGYIGRAGVFELLVINDAIRELLAKGAPVNALKAAARKNGMVSLQEDGLRQVMRGVTSVDELMRAFK